MLSAINHAAEAESSKGDTQRSCQCDFGNVRWKTTRGMPVGYLPYANYCSSQCRCSAFPRWVEVCRKGMSTSTSELTPFQNSVPSDSIACLFGGNVGPSKICVRSGGPADHLTYTCQRRYAPCRYSAFCIQRQARLKLEGEATHFHPRQNFLLSSTPVIMSLPVSLGVAPRQMLGQAARTQLSDQIPYMS